MTPWSIKYFDESGEVDDSWYAKSLADTSICCEIEPGKWAFLVAEIEDPIWIRAFYDGEISEYAEDYPDAEEDPEAYEAYAYDSFFEFFSGDQYYYWNGDRISRISAELAGTTKKWYNCPARWHAVSGQIDRHDRLMANILKARPRTRDLEFIIDEELAEGDPNDVLDDVIDIIEDVNESLREDFANFLYWNGEDFKFDVWEWGIMQEFFPDEYPSNHYNYMVDPDDEDELDDYAEDDEGDEEELWDEDIDDVMKDIGVF